MKTEIEKIPARVARGASWLDAKSPGWERKIDLGTLDISSPTQCVCGQTIGWDKALPLALDSTMGTVDHGFALAGDIIVTQGIAQSYAWEVLTAAWVSLIKDRFDTGALSDS